MMNTTDRQVRDALGTVESLLSGTPSLLDSIPPRIYPHPNLLSQMHSVSYISDDFIAGSRQGGRMSSVRRFFCLLITFDLLFTGLMWLICVMLMGENILVVVTKEIMKYGIKTSLFDIVGVASIRFIFLLIFYGVVQINNWSVIALSTGTTCGFLIVKVFFYHWQSTNQPVFPVLLVLTSFTLAWGEAWFLDFRLLPQENQARQLLVGTGPCAVAAPDTRDTAPLIGNYLQQQYEYRSQYGESNDNFHSPINSPEGSPKFERRAASHPAVGQGPYTSPEQDEQYKAKAKEALNEAWTVLNGPGWKMECKGEQPDDLVESLAYKKCGKIYKLTAVVEVPMDFLQEIMFHKFENMSDWNPTILEGKILKRIDSSTDITYQVTSGGGKGLVSPRDFITLRKFAKIDSSGVAVEGGDLTDADANLPLAYVSAGVSVEIPGWAPTKNYVRGENIVGCWVTRPIRTASGTADPNKVVFQWLMGANLKGRIPSFVVDTALSTAMLQFLSSMRVFIAKSGKSTTPSQHGS